MRDFFEKTAEKLKNGISCYICEIIATEGSTPRGNGARMAVCADGECFGTVGGGEVEYKVMSLAKNILDGTNTGCGYRCGESFIKKYDLNIGEAAKIVTGDGTGERLDMICGGTNTVLFMYVACSGDNSEMFGELAALFNSDTDAWLFTELPGAIPLAGAGLQLGIYTAATGLYFLNGSGWYNKETGRIEADSEEFRELKDFEALLNHNENVPGPEVLHAFGKTYHAECLVKSGTVYVFGGGHVAQELVPIISHTGFRVTVVEDREEYCDRKLFTGVAETKCIPFSEVSEHIEFKKDDYIVIMTRGHAADYEVLLQVARSPVRYIGLMGSKKKVDLTYRKLREDGVSEEALSKIHTPIGLPIGGKTPAEIAISVAVELIMERAHQGRSI